MSRTTTTEKQANASAISRIPKQVPKDFEAYKNMFQKGFNFSGLTGRVEFIGAITYMVIVWILLMVLIWSSTHAPIHKPLVAPLETVRMYYNIVVFVPFVAMLSRRLRDVGLSGWWVLTFVIPFVLWLAQAGLGIVHSDIYTLMVSWVTGVSILVVIVVCLLKTDTFKRSPHIDVTAEPEPWTTTGDADTAKGFSAYTMMYKRGFDFEGRTTKDAFWYAVMLHVGIIAVLSILLWAATHTPVHSSLITPFAFIRDAYLVVTIIPFLSLGMRRLVDVGLSGMMIFLPALPLILVVLGERVPMENGSWIIIATGLTSGVIFLVGLIGVALLPKNYLEIPRALRMDEDINNKPGAEAFIALFPQMTDVKSRTSRATYWNSISYGVGVYLVAGLMALILYFTSSLAGLLFPFAIIMIVYSVPFTLGLVTLTVRRLNDAALSGLFVIPPVFVLLSALVLYLMPIERMTWFRIVSVLGWSLSIVLLWITTWPNDWLNKIRRCST